MLQPVGLIVGARPVEAEDVGEPPLEEAVAPRHGLGDVEAFGGEADLFLVRYLDVALALHAAERLRDRRSRHVHVTGESRADDRLIAACEIVDGAQIVLDGGGSFHAERIPLPLLRGQVRAILPAPAAARGPRATRGGYDGLRPHRAARADPQGSGRPRAELLPRLLAREGPQARVSPRVREGVRGRRLGRPDDSRGLRRCRTRCHRSRHHAPRDLRLGGRDLGRLAIHFYCFPPEPVVRYGTDEMKQRELPRIVSGETIMAFGVTEPNAGTDTSRI